MSMRNNNHTTICWQSYMALDHIKKWEKDRSSTTTRPKNEKKMVCGCLLVVPFYCVKRESFIGFVGCWFHLLHHLFILLLVLVLSPILQVSLESAAILPYFTTRNILFHSNHVHKSNIELISTYNIILLLTLFLVIYPIFSLVLIISQPYRKYYQCI